MAWSLLRTRRSTPEFVKPSRPTPRETKTLSDLDDFRNHHEYTGMVSLYRSAGRMPEDTATAVRAALAEALVHYYPVAGRLRELPGGKLAVDCTGDGVAFVSAEADVRLDELGAPLVPPFPYDGELVCDHVGDIGVVLGKPLLFMQVTRFKCGGFAIGVYKAHCIFDGFGWNQLHTAVADLARGEPAPLLLPVWDRHVLRARTPPSIAAAYPAFRPLVEGSGVHDVLLSTPLSSMAHRLFVFGPREMAVLKAHHVPPHLQRRCTNFDVLTAVTWCCRTAALASNDEPNHQKVYLYFPSVARGRRRGSLLGVPEGYYGNALLYTIVEATVDELRSAVGVRRALEKVCEGRGPLLTQEYAMSTVDLLASLRGRPLVFDGVFVVSDLTRFTGVSVDYGWGEWVGGGIVGPKLASFHMRYKNADGQQSVAVSMALPHATMKRFEQELDMLLNHHRGGDEQNENNNLPRSPSRASFIVK